MKLASHPLRSFKAMMDMSTTRICRIPKHFATPPAPPKKHQKSGVKYVLEGALERFPFSCPGDFMIGTGDQHIRSVSIDCQIIWDI